MHSRQWCYYNIAHSCQVLDFVERLTFNIVYCSVNIADNQRERESERERERVYLAITTTHSYRTINGTLVTLVWSEIIGRYNTPDGMVDIGPTK